MGRQVLEVKIRKIVKSLKCLPRTMIFTFWKRGAGWGQAVSQLFGEGAGRMWKEPGREARRRDHDFPGDHAWPLAAAHKLCGSSEGFCRRVTRTDP